MNIIHHCFDSRDCVQYKMWKPAQPEEEKGKDRSARREQPVGF
jgi:hypothetical protein